MPLLIRLIQSLIVLCPIAIFGWLLNQWFVPSGVFVVDHIVGEKSPFIDELQPGNRVESVAQTKFGDAQQAIIADPVFFFLHPHTDFDDVEFEVWFKNADLPIVELGVLSQTNPEQYTLLPLHNRLIDESSWYRIEKDGLVLLQRERVYDSVKNFLADPPSRDSVAVYRTEFNAPYRIVDYKPSSRVQTIDVSLRGSHEFKTYIKDETMSFDFFYMDMNRDEGPDVLRATVFNEAGQPVAEARSDDDNNTTDNTVATGLKTLSLQVEGLSEGVYKIVLNTTRDIFIRQIRTLQQKIVFLNYIFIGDEVGYRDEATGARIWTQARQLRFETKHAEGVQTVNSSDKSVDIVSPYEWYSMTLGGGGLEEITIPKGDIEVVTEGGISFSRDQFFNPDPVVLNAYATLDQLNIDYVLADYSSPRQVGEWLVANVSFDTAGMLKNNSAWKVSFSSPGIEQLGTRFYVHKIRATLRR